MHLSRLRHFRIAGPFGLAATLAVCCIFNTPAAGIFNTPAAGIFNTPAAGIFNTPAAGGEDYALRKKGAPKENRLAGAVDSARGNSAEAGLREPVALALSHDDQKLYVVTRRSGELYVLDLEASGNGGVGVATLVLGGMLSDLVRLDEHRLAVVDRAAHQLILIATDGEPKVIQRLPVSSHPVAVVASQQGDRCFVSSLWSHRVSQIDTPAGAPARVSRVIDLPFAPRTLLLMQNDSRLIAAAAFAGRLAVIDTHQGALLGVRQFPSHNIRGLAVGSKGKMLLVSHQMLNELAHTVRNDVHWGLLMSNDLRWLPLKGVLEGTADLYAGAHMHPLGDAGHAAGDPAGVAIAKDGLVVVALAGVGEIAFGREDDFSLARMRVGSHPVDVAIRADSRRAYVANQFSDSISVVDLEQSRVQREISLGPMRSLTQLERGERLFYDARLSHDAWMSCHSCHPDGHANGLRNDNFTDASFGAPKQVLSLLGVSETAPYAWNASSPSLEFQVGKSVESTMQGDELEPEKIADLAAYLRSLRPPPSLLHARGQHDDAAIARGRQVFSRQDCIRCHQPPLYTTPRTYDVGLLDEEGNHAFNPPSLRGVSQRGPYFHDGGAESLEDVLQVFGHQLEQPLSDQQSADLLSFLRSL